MKRYKLLRTLPMANVGDEFHRNFKGNLVHTKSGLMFYAFNTLRKNPQILKDWFEEIPERPKTVWDLKDGDTYYYISRDGCVYSNGWSSPLSWHKREIGNVFLTKEEAEKELARRKAKQILLRDTKGFKPSRSDGYRHNEVYYTDKGDLGASSDSGLDGGIYFESYDDAEASIDAHPNEWKTYLGVED